MTGDNSKNWYTARDVSTTLVKGLTVLSAFDHGARQLSLPEIGEQTGYDRATVRRLVITLVDQGLLIKSDRTFALTPKVLGLAANYLRANGIGTTLQPILNRYSDKIGTEISLATVSDGTGLYLARSHMTGAPVSLGFTVGSRLPLLPTAVGRMLLATMPPQTLALHLKQGVCVAYTAQTLMEPDTIQDEVRKAREQGFSSVMAEFEAGVAGLAVPVGRLGQATTVIGVSGPVKTFQDQEKHEVYLSTLQMCAGELDRSWTERL